MVNIFGVISNFNHIPNPEILSRVSDFVIFDQSNDKAIQEFLAGRFKQRVVKTIHCGHNLIDYLSFIIENYETLPDYTMLGKGNMVPRHINLEDFELKTGSPVEDLVPMFSPSYVEQNARVATISDSGWYREKNNDWYVPMSRHRFFASLNDMGRFLYSNWKDEDFISFSPGACYLISRERLKEIPLANYRCLRSILEYDFFPSEAWMIERLLGPLFRNELQLRGEWHEPLSFEKALYGLPDISKLRVSGAGPLSVFRNFAYKIEFKLSNLLEK